jgi:alanine racemase
MKLLHLLRGLKKSLSEYQPLVEVIISQDALLHNLGQYQRAYPKLSFAPVLKSNAYGHGLVEVAQILDRENLPFLIVDSLYEAMALRNNNIKTNILIIGYFSAHNLNSAKLSNTSYVITNLAQLQEIDQSLGVSKQFHLKIDTGMHRQGILSSQIPEALQIIQQNKLIKLEGLCSHFADADGEDRKFSQSQIKEWQQAVDLFRTKFPEIKYFHLANSAGTFYSDPNYCNMARLGIGLYGVNDSPFVKLNLQPAMELQSIISSVKTIPAGDYIGYSITYQAAKPMTIATVPVGYFEGVDRRLSNVGSFTVNGADCPIVGRVSMNITTIDTSNVPNVKPGDKVTVISNNNGAKNSAENIGRLLNTTCREIMVHIPQHLRRVVI